MTTTYPDKLFPHLRSEAVLFAPHTKTVDSGWICGRHIHHMMFELMLVLEGAHTAVLGTTEYEQRAGDLILVSPMQVHDYQARQTGKVSFFTVHVQIENPEFLQLIATANKGFYPQGHPLNEAVVPVLLHFMDIFYEQPEAKLSLFSKLYAILEQIQNHLSADNRHTSPVQTSELPSRIALEIQNLVLNGGKPADMGEPAAPGDWLEGISRRLGISRRHCHRVFRQAYGMPPRDYFMVLKQQEAVHMLMTSNESIERIAHRIGYENVQSFSRQFTAWVGCTPGNFRRNNL
ncbi:helix-turn-helix domain-containing protein [Paenibacillus ihumii]|uniref:helix-turn-helix domain-containing protein n=1 Tax=Paenibacillus ihumii TaxID=687436 RepID=UPI0006D7EE8A|nr:AraC family transcriptional regulator [Paenibacillus ihumii]